jgi:PAS domain S-box-containing protein
MRMNKNRFPKAGVSSVNTGQTTDRDRKSETEKPITDGDRGGWLALAGKEDIVEILERVPCGIVVNRRPHGDVLYINPATFDLVGYTATEIPNGQAAAEVLHPDRRERTATRKRLEQAIRSGGGIVRDNIVCKDGTRKVCETRIVVLPNGMQVSIWTDVTRREEAEAALRKANGELEERVRRRSEEIEALAMERELLLKEMQGRREQALRQSREELRNLSEHLQKAREEERTRISREVHDEIGQLLSAIKIDLLSVDSNQGSEHTRNLTDKIDETIRTVRKICSELRPPVLEDFGLVAAIEWQLEEFQKSTGIASTVRASRSLPELDKDLNLVLFRVFQEAITNIARHANATEVKVSMSTTDGKLLFKVSDNGRGITRKHILSPRSLGIIGMRERLRFWRGELILKGARGRGTVLTVLIPAEAFGEAGFENQTTGEERR